MRHLRGFVALAIVCAVATVGRAQSPLAWKLEKGKTYKYAIVETTDSKAKVQNQDIATKMVQTMDVVWEVLGVDSNGSMLMTQMISRMHVKSESAQAPFEYDTDQTEAPAGAAAMLAPVLGALVKQPIEMRMSSRGVISDVKVPPAILDKLKNAGPGAAMLQNLASEQGLKNLMSRSGLTFPATQVAKGTPWQEKDEVTLPFGKIKVTKTFTFEGSTTEAGKSLEKIGLKLNVDAVESDPNAQFKITVEDQKSDGYYLFDGKAGLLEKASITQTMKLKVTVMGMDVITDTTTKVLMRRN